CRRTTRTPLCAFFIFFFQAEDGIRDATVTGVQTCALPISRGDRRRRRSARARAPDARARRRPAGDAVPRQRPAFDRGPARSHLRSEERRVGKEGRSGGWA